MVAVALLALGACSSSGAGEPTGVGGSAGTSAAAGSGGGAVSSGGQGVAGSGPAGRGGTTATGGSGPGGSTSGEGGSVAAGGAGGMAPAGRGGSSGPAGAGGAPSGGSGGTAVGGRGGGTAVGGSGGAPATACTRELLKSAVAAYFTALGAHDPATLPLASNVKFTENGKVSAVGSMGLWKTAGAVKYTQSVLDTELCSSATHAVVPDGTKDIPVAVRLKLVDQMLTEIETIAVRQGDYSVTSNPAAIIAINDTVKWEQSVPTAQRATRAEIIAWMDKYFREFPNGVCNVTSDCKRLENGGGNYSCSGGASCVAGAPSGTPAATPRIILADTETGMGGGLTILLSSTDMHQFKMYGGQVHAVHAILGAASSSGW